MDKSQNEVRTSALWQALFKAPSVNQYIAENDGALELPPFADYIQALCNGRGEVPERVIRRGGIEPSFGHRLFRGTHGFSRDTVLQLAFGLELNVEQAQQLLKVARASALHPKVKRDAVIAYCLQRHMPITEAQQTLQALDLPVIGGVVGE